MYIPFQNGQFLPVPDPCPATFDLVLKRIWNPIDFQGQRSRSLGTYLVLKRIWNPIYFQGQRSRSQGKIFRRGDTPRFALPLFKIKLVQKDFEG
jgi:hypothetical protein